ncbi:MAG: DNA-processing protein DprA [Microcella sp.]|uniref:DNA-processing protein DprA n=1 Tax=Microcella sp. TaxID=1913979 RepID=UPI0033154700
MHDDTTNDWGLAPERIAALLAPLRPRAENASEGTQVSVPSLDEVFARVLWSVVVEPGDSVAGSLVQSLGPVSAALLLLSRPTPEGVVRAVGAGLEGELSRDDVEHALGRWAPRLRCDDVVRALESAARCQAQLLVPGDAEWPVAVDDLGAHRPHLLWVRGTVALLARPSVAIVGARAATGYGEHVAMELAAGLAGRDVTVVSGGAYGIDGMAHRAALASGGATIAALAGGIDRLYPSGHEALLTRIAEQGALVSEVPCGTAPTKWRFLQRNRLIAALSRATVVVEAGHRSGALNTARHADTLSREVGVIPGPITSAASAGCHRLLRSGGAHCVTSVPEVMELAFGSDAVLDLDGPCDTMGAREPAVHTRVIDALRPRRGQTVAELSRAVGEEQSRVRAALGALQLDGRATLTETGHWVRARS